MIYNDQRMIRMSYLLLEGGVLLAVALVGVALELALELAELWVGVVVVVVAEGIDNRIFI